MSEWLPLWHIAHQADWEAAQEDGVYLHATRGATLGEVGFIHAAYPHQIALVARQFYADDPAPLVILEIDRESLGGAPVRVEMVEGVAFPHIFGPLPVAAVGAVRPLSFDNGAPVIGDAEAPGGAVDGSCVR